jgi:alpha-mannosidase
MSKPILYLHINNHFDPMWRRCWDRRFTFKGETYVSYADLEEYYLLDNLELARQHPEYKFEAEFTLVVQKFLKRHPELLEELQKLSKAGRFAVTGGGQVIVDGNMILGESLVRNYLLGLLWVEEVFGQKTRLAVRNDAFGNSAQLPQILRGCEIEWATGMSYSVPSGRYWRGLDGSVVLHATLPSAGSGGGITKYAACPNCEGTRVNCPRCQGRGIDASERAWLPSSIDLEAFTELGCARIMIGPEELLPNPELITWAQAMSRNYDVRFALEEEALPHLQPWLENLDQPAPDQVHPSVELNPNNSGVLVSRIKTKQSVRRREYALLHTEFLAVQTALLGDAYPRAEIGHAWQKLLFTMFHDAITATHVDSAYEELMDTGVQIDTAIDTLRKETLEKLVTSEPGQVSVINPGGANSTQVVTAWLPGNYKQVGLVDEQDQPAKIIETESIGEKTRIAFIAEDIPALSARAYRLAQAQTIRKSITRPAKALIENERFAVEADEHGLLSVFDKVLSRNILQNGEYRPAELILEHDEGSPWATLHPDQSRLPFSADTHLEALEKSDHFQCLIYNVSAPFRAGYVSHGLQARLVVQLTEGIQRLDFKLHVSWDTFNHRLRVAMPVPAVGKHIYGIPYGILERQPYSPRFDWTGVNGDWPAVNWAGVEMQGMSVALLNKGLPSYRIEAGDTSGSVILLSVLRSPAIPTYLHEPEFYTMTDYDGMRDAGDHDFEFSVTGYPERFAESQVVVEAESYIAGLLAVPGAVRLAAMPLVHSDCARLSAIKWAEKEPAVILRLCEFRGKGGGVEIELPGWVKHAWQVNLLERGAKALKVENHRVQLKLHPWEITTLKLEVG